MTLRGRAGSGLGLGLGTGTASGDIRPHGMEDSNTPPLTAGHTYGPGDFPDTPQRHDPSTRHHPLVVNDATLMIEPNDHHRMGMGGVGGSHVCGYTMGSIPEAGPHSTTPSAVLYSLLCTLSARITH